MSLDELQEDFKANLQRAKSLASDPEVTPRQIMQHLVGSLWPMLESHIEETVAMADAIDDVIDEAGDMLQAETAGVFASLVVVGMELVTALKSRLGPAETDLANKISMFEQTAKAAGEILEEITVESDDETEAEDSEDEDDE